MRILDVKDGNVTQGVLDKDVTVEPTLVQVTYADDTGTPHTVFAHKDGPFKSPEEIAQAHRDGLLHTDEEQRDAPEQAAPPAGPVIE